MSGAHRPQEGVIRIERAVVRVGDGFRVTTPKSVFNLAEADQQSVSMEMVRTRLARLAEYPPGCCPLCAAAAKVAPADVYRIASAWRRPDQHHQGSGGTLTHTEGL